MGLTEIYRTILFFVLFQEFFDVLTIFLKPISARTHSVLTYILFVASLLLLASLLMLVLLLASQLLQVFLILYICLYTSVMFLLCCCLHACCCWPSCYCWGPRCCLRPWLLLLYSSLPLLAFCCCWRSCCYWLILLFFLLSACPYIEYLTSKVGELSDNRISHQRLNLSSFLISD